MCVCEQDVYYLNESGDDGVQCLSDDLETVLVVTAQETRPHEREHWHYVMQHSTLVRERVRDIQYYTECERERGIG